MALQQVLPNPGHPRQTTSSWEPGIRSVYGFSGTGTTGYQRHRGLPERKSEHLLTQCSEPNC